MGNILIAIVLLFGLSGIEEKLKEISESSKVCVSSPTKDKHD